MATTVTRARSDRRTRAPEWITAHVAQTVTRAAYRLQPLPADLAPQVAGVDLDRVGVDLGVVPDMGQQVGLGHDHAGVAHEVLQHGVLARRQVDGSSLDRHGTGGGVELEGTDHEGHRARRGRAPEQRAQPGEQHDEGERLGEVVVGTEVEPVGLVVLAVLGRRQQDRRPDALGPQPPGDLVAAQPGQHHVQDDRVVRDLARHREAAYPVVADVDREAGVHQPALHRRRHPLLVLDEK